MQPVGGLRDLIAALSAATAMRVSIERPPFGLEIVLAHQTAPLLGVYHDAVVAKCGAHPSVAVVFELIGDRAESSENLVGIRRCRGSIVERRSREAHQLASFADGDAAGPVTTKVLALLGRGACFKASFSGSISSAWRPTIRSSAAILASYFCSRSAACTSSSGAPAPDLPTHTRIRCRERSCRCDNRAASHLQ